MNPHIFNRGDLRQLTRAGIAKKKVMAQIGRFKKGTPFLTLERPCTAGDGILILTSSEENKFSRLFEGAAQSGRAMKFVPASGAASRMFQFLQSFRYRDRTIGEVEASAIQNPNERMFFEFISNLNRFAFYNDLRSALAKRGADIGQTIAQGRFKEIAEALLSEEGLNYAHQPKALIPFHKYADHCRTALEEHLVEACGYVRDKNNVVRIHFTVAPEQGPAIRRHTKNVKSLYEKSGVRLKISFSDQKHSGNTIAVDPDNKPFRGADGKLVFRPAGHGALLANLHKLNGDIIFIKNIDNIVSDSLKEATYHYKKVLGGILVDLQNNIFNYLKQLTNKSLPANLLEEIVTFSEASLFIKLPQGIKKKQIRIFLIDRLNRPIRVCGMVKNTGEPGGGPFWVRSKDGGVSMQIVEQSQVDAAQNQIWNSSTHFNPVDLVCGVKDYRGRHFDLMKFCDPGTYSVSVKSQDGRAVKALELPGLWNGGMANWITVFVEVPVVTFNPVKTLTDLLRKEHQ